jgi:hypothetical protein
VGRGVGKGEEPIEDIIKLFAMVDNESTTKLGVPGNSSECVTHSTERGGGQAATKSLFVSGQRTLSASGNC